MKTFIKILPLLAILVAFSSCRKDDISDKVAGEYVLNAQDEIIVNNTKGIITDYPDASIKIKPAGDNLITVTLNNILVSNKEFILSGEVVEGTKVSDGLYSFLATGEDETMSVTASGTISGESISINIEYSLKYDLIGKWTFSNKTEPDIYFNFTSKEESFIFGDDTIKISDIVSLIDASLVQAASMVSSANIELTEHGYFNINSDDKGIMDTLNMFVNNRLEFYSDATYFNLHIKPSWIEIADGFLSEYGINIFKTVSSLTVQISYKQDGDNLNLELNQTNTKAYLTMIQFILSNFTYQQFIAIDPETAITEADFNGYKALATNVITLALDKDTSFALGVNLQRLP